MTNFLKAAGGRKFLLVLIVMAVACATPFVIPTTALQTFYCLLAGLYVSFVVSNALCTWAYEAAQAKIKQKRASGAVAPKVDLSDIEVRLEQVAMAVADPTQVQALSKIMEDIQLLQQSQASSSNLLKALAEVIRK